MHMSSMRIEDYLYICEYAVFFTSQLQPMVPQKLCLIMHRWVCCKMTWFTLIFVDPFIPLWLIVLQCILCSGEKFWLITAGRCVQVVMHRSKKKTSLWLIWRLSRGMGADRRNRMSSRQGWKGVLWHFEQHSMHHWAWGERGWKKLATGMFWLWMSGWERQAYQQWTNLGHFPPVGTRPYSSHLMVIPLAFPHPDAKWDTL